MAEGQNNDEMIAQFQSISGADVDRARFFLESSNWKLDLAIASFFENDDASAPASASASEPAPEAASKEPEAPREKAKSNVNTLASMMSDSDSDGEEDQGQAYFAGGSETSGQQILGPPKKKGADFVSEMFKRARESGAEAVEGESSAGGSSSRSSAFTGSAFKLGSDTTPSEMVAQAGGASQKPPPPREFTLKMWSNGFSIDDGELRPYNDPGNREFLQSVMVGRIPKELIREAKGGEVHVNMEDHKTEEFVKPKATSKPFQGTGHMLGSTVPSFTSNTPSVPPPTEENNSTNESAAQERFKVDENQPNTVIQVRLNDGSRLIIKMNVSRTVSDLREYITLARPHLATIPFNLMTTFPNKVLEDDSLDLKTAGLQNAAILLRPK